MEFPVSIRRIAVGLILGIYVSALIVLPVVHVPHPCHETDLPVPNGCCRTDCLPGETPEPVSSSSCGNDCEFCRFLHLTVPFFVCADVSLETSDTPPEPLPLSTVFGGADVFGLPSSRAPPTIA